MQQESVLKILTEVEHKFSKSITIKTLEFVPEDIDQAVCIVAKTNDFIPLPPLRKIVSLNPPFSLDLHKIKITNGIFA